MAGDGGLTGSYIARQYHQLGFEVHGVSRRPLETEWTRHRADLLTGEGLPADILSRVTHIVFAAYVEKPTDAELIEVNDVLLRGALDAINEAFGLLMQRFCRLSPKSSGPSRKLWIASQDG